MFQLSNASNALIDRCLRSQTPQAFGSFFQHAVAAALNGIDGYRGCHAHPAAGQPDIIAGKIGVEVKTSASSSIRLQGNYAAIREQYPSFKLIGLRTDLKAMWALDIPELVPDRIELGALLTPPLSCDSQLESALKGQLSRVLETAGILWSDAEGPDAARSVLERVSTKREEET